VKSVDLDFCEDCVYRKQKRVSFSMVRKTLKAEKLELVYTDVKSKAQFPPSKAHCILRPSSMILVGKSRCIS